MKIAIVGAGLTACLLSKFLSADSQDDAEITIFEKSRGCGGRASTKQTPWGQCDLGATIIPIKGDAFSHFMHGLAQLGIASQWPSKVYSSQPNRDSSFSLTEFKSDRQYFVFNQKMNSACRQWINGAKLNTQSVVSQIRKQAQQGWQLKVADTWSPELFDKLVVTAPWPQSMTLLNESGLFSELSADAQNWTSCWSVGLKVVPTKASEFDLIYQKNHPVQTLVRDSAKPSRPSVKVNNKSGLEEIWVVQLSHAESDKLTKEGKQKAIDLASHNLCELLQLSPGAVSETYAHYWRYARPSSGEKPLGIIEHQQSGLLVGGDWSFGVSIESAFEAACALKQAIAEPQ
jgi:predicted NAD/FAD-dependent oxidoreductase